MNDLRGDDLVGRFLFAKNGGFEEI
jgi:hypothetical protein